MTIVFRLFHMPIFPRYHSKCQAFISICHPSIPLKHAVVASPREEVSFIKKVSHIQPQRFNHSERGLVSKGTMDAVVQHLFSFLFSLTEP